MKTALKGVNEACLCECVAGGLFAHALASLIVLLASVSRLEAVAVTWVKAKAGDIAIKFLWMCGM